MVVILQRLACRVNRLLSTLYEREGSIEVTEERLDARVAALADAVDDLRTCRARLAPLSMILQSLFSAGVERRDLGGGKSTVVDANVVDETWETRISNLKIGR